MSFEEYTHPNEKETWEQYRARHYRSQYMKAHDMIVDLFDVDVPLQRELFLRMLTALVDKMWTPEVYLREAYLDEDRIRRTKPFKKEAREARTAKGTRTPPPPTPEPKSGGPEKDAHAPAKNMTPSSPRRQHEVLVRKPTQTLTDQINEALPKDRELLYYETTDKHVLVRFKQYLGPDLFRRVAEKLRPFGAVYVSRGKDSHFRIKRADGEKQ